MLIRLCDSRQNKEATMKRPVRSPVWGAYCLLVFLFLAPYARADGVSPVEPVRANPREIVGTLTINGCIADPTLAKVRAVPLGLRPSDGRSFTSDAYGRTRAALLTRTRDPHVLAFSIKGLKANRLYRIGVAYPPNPCAPSSDDLPAKIFWRGPKHGLVVSGGPTVSLEGFAARTQLEVQQPETGEWLGADDLQFDDPAAATRTLRWRTSIRGVIGAELQVSTEPFPTKGNFGCCDEPETGIVTRQMVAVQGDPREDQYLEPINFHQLLGERYTDGISRGEAGIGAFTEVTPLSDHARRLLMAGAPLYIRVIPQTADGPLCAIREGGISGWVMLAKIPGAFNAPLEPTLVSKIQPWAGHGYKPPYVGGPNQGRPGYGELGFKIIKDHTLPTLQEVKSGSILFDPLGTEMVLSGQFFPGSHLKKNQWFVFTPPTSSSDGNFFSDFVSVFEGLGSAFGGLVTATVNFTGSFVDYLHNLTEQIKSTLAENVVSLVSYVPGVGPLCDALAGGQTSCESVVKAGLEYGMTSMGMPPSIPSWEALKDQGADYLAAEVVSEIGDPTGLSKEFVKQKAKEIMVLTMGKVSAARGGKDPRYDWVIPYLGFEPAIWTISVHKTTTEDLGTNLFLRIPKSPLYLGANVHVPSRFPATNLLKIPVGLQPNTENIPAPVCRENPFNFLDPAPPISCTAAPLPPDKPTCWSWRLKTNNQYGWVKWDCASVNWVGIYYRDAWTAQEYKPTGCVPLSAVSYSLVGKLLWLIDSPPFLAIATLPPQFKATWNDPLHAGCP